jgi:antitoxin component HigA of HigAB toxin-antitoxin module
MKKKITAGNIQRAIKAKKTWSQLEQEYDCTQDEIKARIKDLFKGGGDNIIRQISGNTNAQEKQSRRRSTDASVGNSRVANPTSSSRPIKAAPNPAEQLEELKRYDNEVLGEIATLQNERSQLVNRLHLHALEFQKLAEELKGIIQSFRSWIERYKHIIKDVDEARKKLSDIDRLLQEKRGLCEGIQEWQKALSVSTEARAHRIRETKTGVTVGFFFADTSPNGIVESLVSDAEFQSLSPSERLAAIKAAHKAQSMLRDSEADPMFLSDIRDPYSNIQVFVAGPETTQHS